MSLASWVAFTAAYILMAATPGPVILLVVSYAVTQGRRTALAVVAGTALGDATCLAGAVFGLGALLATSAAAFMVLKLAGSLYLIWLGVQMWRAPPLVPAADLAPAEAPSQQRAFLNAYLSTALNPKSVLFFLLFTPQFMAADAPLLPQFLALLASVLVCSAAVDGSYSLLGSGARHFIGGPRTQRRVNRVAGSLLVGQGIAAASWRGL